MSKVTSEVVKVMKIVNIVSLVTGVPGLIIWIGVLARILINKA